VRVVIIPAALRELHDAAAFYSESANVNLGHAFLAEFEQSIERLRGSPEIAPVYRGTKRRYLLRRFPYSIIFHIVSEELRVIAVAHQRRRPAYWSRRS
jgi:toxin ParE1/3/4